MDHANLFKLTDHAICAYDCCVWSRWCYEYVLVWKKFLWGMPVLSTKKGCGLQDHWAIAPAQHLRLASTLFQSRACASLWFETDSGIEFFGRDDLYDGMMRRSYSALCRLSTDISSFIIATDRAFTWLNLSRFSPVKHDVLVLVIQYMLHPFPWRMMRTALQAVSFPFSRRIN